jgi:NAD+ synthase (glutamine-hydrolysing)
VIHDGKLLGFADKTLLPEYDVFDDPRWFEPNDGKHRRLFEVGGIKLGVVVCEDFWNDKTFWKERLYDSDPTDEVIAHLLMMRGSEEKFWANANQHPLDRPSAGL